MAELTYFNLTDATERSTASTSLVEITQSTVNWSDLTTAGFAATDVVYIIWNWSLGGSNANGTYQSNIGHGTTFAGRTDFLPVNTVVEPMGTASLNGHSHLGWVEEHTLITSENFYFALSAQATLTARRANFSVTFIKKADLAADDYRYNAVSNALAVNTGFQTDATVTLPSGGGDDWLILGCGDWDISSVSRNIEQRINIGASNVMTLSMEGEDGTEQHQQMCVYYHASAGASDVVNFQAREDGSSSEVLDSSRVLAIRLDAFVDHIGLTDTTTDALSTTPDTYVETGTVSLSLTSTGNVFVIGETIVDPTTTSNDPYLRLQEGGADIVSALGRASDRARDSTDLVGVVTHAVESMTSGTKTIDMDVAQDLSTSTANAIERTLVAFSMELVGADPGDISATTDALTLTEFAATVNAETSIAAGVDALTLTEYPATVTVDADTNIAATTDALTLTEYPATVNAETSVQAGVDALTLTEFPASVNAETSVQATVDALTLTEYPANVSFGIQVSAGVDNLTLTEYPATITRNINVLANADALVLTEYPAVVDDGLLLLDITDTDILELPVDYQLNGDIPYKERGNTFEPSSGKSEEKVRMRAGGSMLKPKPSFTVTTSKRGYD